MKRILDIRNIDVRNIDVRKIEVRNIDVFFSLKDFLFSVFT